MNTPPNAAPPGADAVKDVDTELCLSVLARFMTRRNKNPLERSAQRLAYLKNMRDIEKCPEQHLAATLQMIGTHGPSFDGGLQLGVCIALASRGGPGKELLLRILTDLTTEHERPADLGSILPMNLNVKGVTP